MNLIRDDKKRKKVEIAVLVIMGLVISAIYESLSSNVNIWTDEAYTISLLNHTKTLGDVAAYTARDVHPPMYYWILKLVTSVTGVNWYIVKLCSVVAMLCVYLLSAFPINRRFGFKTALFFTIFVAAIPVSMEYAIQMRMYAWCMFFVTGAFMSAVSVYENGRIRDYIFLMICGVSAAYSHYFAFVAVLWIYGILFLMLLFGKKGKSSIIRYWLMALCSVGLYIPWMPYFAKQVGGVSESYWIDEITWDTIKDFYKWIFDCDYPGVVLMFRVLCTIGIVILIIRLIRFHRAEEKCALWAISIPILVVITGVVLSWIIRPIFIIRYVMPALALFCLGLSIVASRVSTEVYALLLVFLLVVFRIDYICTYVDEYQSTDTDATLTALAQNMQEGDILTYNYEAYGYLYKCYFGDGLPYIEDVDLDACTSDVYFMCTARHPSYTAAELADRGWKLEYLGDYGFEQNPFWLYRFTRED